MRIPVVGLAQRVVRIVETPAEAPTVQKRLLGFAG